MPITKIDTVHMSLLGLCFLKDEQRNILKEEWNDRFNIDTDTALWVDLDPSEDFKQMEDMILASYDKNRHTLKQSQCIMVAFLDFQQPIPAGLPDALKKLQVSIDRDLDLATNTFLQFGYAGLKGNSNGQVARENTMLLANENAKHDAGTLHKVCLVASAHKTKYPGINWRTVSVFLDLLRRQPTIAEFLPDGPDGRINNDIAYLRYAEYDKISYCDLVEKQKKNQLMLNSDTDEPLVRLYNKRRQDLKDRIAHHFPITSGAHPIHPGMEVTGRMKIRRAMKGKYEPYNTAAANTMNAVSQTAARMENEIMLFFSQQIPDFRKELSDMFEDAKVSIKIKKDAALIHTIFTVTEPGIRPTLPMLSYTPAGPSATIHDYLTRVQKYFIDCCIADYEKRLRAAYDELHQQGFDEEEQLLDAKNAKISKDLAEIMTPEIIFKKVRNVTLLPESSLQPVGISGSQKSYVIFRGDPETQKEVNNLEKNITAYQIMPFTNDPESKKRWPVKAVQMLVSDCSEETLNGMINW